MRVLLIEDNPSLSRLIELELQDEGFEVTLATNGEDGLDLANRLPFDVILLDIMLPEMNGVDVLKAIRLRDEETPLMMLTAQATMTTTVECLSLGADDYLKKPFEIAEMIARINTIMRRRALGSKIMLKIGEVKIDFKGATVKKGDHDVILKKQEWEVLRALLTSRGRTLSKDVLYECLSQEVSIPESNLIEVLIYGLRQKLGKDLIKNKRGLGYIIQNH